MAGCGPVNGRYVAVGGGAQHGAYVFGCEARVLEFVFDLDLIEEAVVPQVGGPAVQAFEQVLKIPPLDLVLVELYKFVEIGVISRLMFFLLDEGFDGVMD